MKSIDKLDWILKFLDKRPEAMGGISDADLLEEYIQAFPSSKKLPNNGSLIVAMLNKLYKDGYIRIDSYNKYWIEFDGIRFIENGGYIKQEKNEKLKKARELTVITLTIIIGIATAYTGYLQYSIQRRDNTLEDIVNTLQNDNRKSKAELSLKTNQIEVLKSEINNIRKRNATLENKLELELEHKNKK